MNIIDLAIILVLVVNLLIGAYYGFTVSFFKIISYIISWFFSLLFHSSLTRLLVERFPDLISKIAYFSEGSSKTPFEQKILPVASLSQDQIVSIVNESGLPNPFSNRIQENLINQSLEGLENIGQYFDYTVASIIMNLISFILLFIALELILTLIISLTQNIIDLPVLVKYDGVAAAVLGLFRGFLFLYILFAFIPLLYLVVPADILSTFIDESRFIDFFLNTNIFSFFVKGTF
ncbi:MAG: CvpA family protein [Caldicoprobacterales bacterium]